MQKFSKHQLWFLEYPLQKKFQNRNATVAWLHISGLLSLSNVYSELWSADWWKEQQAELGKDALILALIIYADETNVTFNGRNMHPVYISLGNLHVEYR